jgi:tetratricopeptide (TPR) repeat protein
MSRRHRTAVTGAMLVGAVLCGATLRAAPYRPAQDDVVLEVLARPSSVARLTTRANGATSSEDALQRRVRALIELARASGDPRELGRAEALLKAAPVVAPMPTERLVLQATVDQALHRFGAALETLDAVLAREPLHAQALLTRATVLQVQGKTGLAARDCTMLARASRPLVATTCTASVESLRGRGHQAYVVLEFALRSSGSESPELLAWSWSVLAGIAERAGRADDADAAYRAAVALAPDNPYVLAAYADRLLDAGEPDVARALVAGRRANDNLFLREVIALHRLNDAGAAEAITALAARYALAQQRGEALHLREQGRFELDVRGDAGRALELAIGNWKVQREPIDARLLYEAAVAADNATQAAVARRWLEAAGIAPEYVHGRSSHDARFARAST